MFSVVLFPASCSRHNEEIHHRAHKDHRQMSFCLHGEELRFSDSLTRSSCLRLCSVASVVKSFLGCRSAALRSLRIMACGKRQVGFLPTGRQTERQRHLRVTRRGGHFPAIAIQAVACADFR